MNKRTLIPNFAKLLLLTVFLIGCKDKPMQYETKQTIVNAKANVKVDGSDKFILSFSDGDSEYCSFGDYTKYKVGDTLCWRREKHFFGMWYIQDCH